MSLTTDPLFSRIEIFNLEKQLLADVRQAAERLAPRDFEGKAINDVAQAVASRYQLVPITIKADDKYAQNNKYDEKILDVVVPFEGSRELFGVRPSNFSFSLGRRQAATVNQGNFVLQYMGQDAERIRAEIDGDLSQIGGNIASLNQDVARLNSSIFATAQSVVTHRKQALDDRNQLSQNLGMPFKG